MSCEHDECYCQGRDLGKEKEMLKEYGFFSHMVPNGDDSTPTGANFHTHGMPESVDHPDIQIVIPLPIEIYGSVIHSVYEFVKQGNKLELERAYDNFLGGGYHVQFAWAVENGRDVMRLILPDKNNETMKEVMNKDYAKQWEGTYPLPQKNKLEE